MLNSGYHDCPCRDCFEIAIGCDDEDRPDLCNECEEAGCSANADESCQREDVWLDEVEPGSTDNAEPGSTVEPTDSEPTTDDA